MLDQEHLSDRRARRENDERGPDAGAVVIALEPADEGQCGEARGGRDRDEVDHRRQRELVAAVYRARVELAAEGESVGTALRPRS